MFSAITNVLKPTRNLINLNLCTTTGGVVGQTKKDVIN